MISILNYEGGIDMDEVKILSMLQEMSEKFDTIIALLKKIETNTGDIYCVRSELEDVNTNMQRIFNKMD